MMPEYVIAGLWGLLSGSGLLVGAVLADVLFGRLTHRMISAAMGFGGGVLIAVVATELIGDRVSAGMGPLAIFALLAGAAIFSGTNWFLSRQGAKHRKRCGECTEQATEQEHRGSGAAIALGSVLDGIPEALVIGMSVAGGGRISLAEHKLKDVRERMADLARMEAVLSDLVCACHARKGNVSCPLIASLQGKKEPRSADAV